MMTTKHQFTRRQILDFQVKLNMALMREDSRDKRHCSMMTHPLSGCTQLPPENLLPHLMSMKLTRVITIAFCASENKS